MELIHAVAQTPEAFWQSEPTWAAQFPAEGDRTFATPPPEDKEYQGFGGI